METVSFEPARWREQAISPPILHYHSSRVVWEESRRPSSRTTVRCEGSQLCKEKNKLGDVVPSVSQLRSGAWPDDHGRFPSSRERMCDCMAQGWLVPSSLPKMAYPKPVGASARGEKKLI